MAKQRISYVSLDDMDADMRKEMERCQREGTPRPESSAVRAHVKGGFWLFANYWRERVELGCFIGLTLGQQSWLRLLDIEHHQVLPGTDASMAPGFKTAEELARSKASGSYWASKKNTKAA